MNTHFADTSISGVRYMLCTFLTMLSVPGNGPIGERNAPISAKPVKRVARNVPSFAERQLADELVIAAVTVGEKAARAFVGPFHRPAERAGAVQHADIFRKQHALHAERAADLAGQDVHRLGVDAERVGNLAAHAGHALRADIKCKAAAVVGGNRGARLHGVDHDPAVDELQAGDVRGRGEGGFDRGAVAIVIIERNIAGHVLVKERSASRAAPSAVTTERADRCRPRPPRPRPWLPARSRRSRRRPDRRHSAPCLSPAHRAMASSSASRRDS